jgi:hypothetical protein
MCVELLAFPCDGVSRIFLVPKMTTAASLPNTTCCFAPSAVVHEEVATSSRLSDNVSLLTIDALSQLRSISPVTIRILLSDQEKTYSSLVGA